MREGKGRIGHAATDCSCNGTCRVRQDFRKFIGRGMSDPASGKGLHRPRNPAGPHAPSSLRSLSSPLSSCYLTVLSNALVVETVDVHRRLRTRKGSGRIPKPAMPSKMVKMKAHGYQTPAKNEKRKEWRQKCRQELATHLSKSQSDV